MSFLGVFEGVQVSYAFTRRVPDAVANGGFIETALPPRGKSIDPNPGIRILPSSEREHYTKLPRRLARGDELEFTHF